MYQIISSMDRYFKFGEVSAHCDIPCKIYDPITAQLAVLSMHRMMSLISDLTSKNQLSIAEQGLLSRLVAEKEKQGLVVKDEIRVIWGDYFKSPQISEHPEIHHLVHSIMLKTSYAKQHFEKQATIELLGLVNEFAEIFWQTKGVKTYRAKCPYPPCLEVSYAKLS